MNNPAVGAACSARRDRLEKLAEALGWMRCERIGKDVWYGPTGGHVTWEDLPDALADDINQLIAECKDKSPRADRPNAEISHDRERRKEA